MKDLGYLKTLPFYRMKVQDQIPELGNIEVTPSYIYIKKNKANEIIKIQTIGLPIGRAREFVQEINQLGRMRGKLIRDIDTDGYK